MIWFTSDLHFYHKQVIGYCNRPYSNVEEMNRDLIERWNSKIKKREIVWVLGDFSFAGIQTTKDVVSQLKGDIRIVRGNHDRYAKQLIEMGFSNVYENHSIWLEGYKVNLSHFPHRPTKEQMEAATHDMRYLHKRIYNDGLPLLHGHTHSPEKVNIDNGLQIHVGIDAWDMSPVSHKEIIKLIEENNGLSS